MYPPVLRMNLSEFKWIDLQDIKFYVFYHFGFIAINTQVSVVYNSQEQKIVETVKQKFLEFK